MSITDVRSGRTDIIDDHAGHDHGASDHAPGTDHGPGSDGGFDHGWRSRANAAFFTAIDRYAAYVSRWHKRVAFDALAATSIVEIGPGVGANFSHYPDGATVWAIEPNTAMHPRLTERARRSGIDLRLVPNSASTLPFDDGSVDCVVSTLVLCTVDDPDAVLAEIRRILRPGGTFRFVEHIAAPPARPRRLLQQALHRPWAWLFEGCDLLRHTDTAIQRAGFEQVDLHHRRFRRSVFIPVNSAVAGVARAGTTGTGTEQHELIVR